MSVELAEVRPPRPEFAAPAMRKALRERLTILCLTGLVLVVATAGLVVRTAGPADAHLFQAKPANGQKLTYELTMTIEGSGFEAAGTTESVRGSLTMTVADTVVNVNPDGSSWHVLEVSNVRPNFEGLEPPPVGEGTMRITVAPNGQITEVKEATGIFEMFSGGFGAALPAGGGQALGAQPFVPVFPENPVAPGDDWSSTESIPVPGFAAPIELKMSGRHAGFENTTYGKAARLTAEMHGELDMSATFGALLGGLGSPGLGGPPGAGSPGDASVSIDGTFDMDASSVVLPEDGSLVGLDAELTFAMSMALKDVPAEFAAGAPQAMNFTFKLSLDMRRVS